MFCRGRSGGSVRSKASKTQRRGKKLITRGGRPKKSIIGPNDLLSGKSQKKLAPANCLVGAIRQLGPVSIALITSPSRPRKVMGVGVAGRLLGVQVKVRGRVCYPCYTKPEATAARKKNLAEKKRFEEWHQP